MSPRAAAHRSHRGQSFVEFALVLPMLIVLLLGVVDFGRVFAAGITLEAAARNGAEIAALEYERSRPDPGSPDTYIALHQLAAETACEEMKDLPNATYVSGVCTEMPAIRVCIHDDLDPLCGDPIAGWSDPHPPECTGMASGWSNVRDGGTFGHNYVEVRLCYRFTTLLNLNFSLPMNAGLSLGDVWLQRTAIFVVPCWAAETEAC